MATKNRTCTIDGCDKEAERREWCNTHCLRWRRNGDPVAGRRPQASASLDPIDRLRHHGWDVTETGCWEWRGSTSSSGYGQVRIGYKLYAAHRVMYEHAVGPIEDGMHILHSCDNPPCLNPAHLRSGTHTDNMRDMSSKGRRRPDSVLPRGSQHANAILTEELVIDLRTERRGGMTYKQLAAKYGVAFSTVADIVKRKKWRHVGG